MHLPSRFSFRCDLKFFYSLSKYFVNIPRRAVPIKLVCFQA